jgi:hypothetical protein
MLLLQLQQQPGLVQLRALEEHLGQMLLLEALGRQRR